jgi:hypothetical protein
LKSLNQDAAPKKISRMADFSLNFSSGKLFAPGNNFT